MTDVLTRALTWIGVDPSPAVRTRLTEYSRWLADEAIPAGAIGPRERDRLEARHVADSLLFAGVWDRRSTAQVIDVGSGAGLPGIPLALAVPHRPFLLVDRSGRRVQLLRRAVRVLGLENVDVQQRDIDGLDWSGATVVSRASLPPAALRALAARQGSPRELLVGGSHRARPEAAGFDTVEIPAEILAWPVWILRMGQ